MLPSGDDRNNPKWPDTLSEASGNRRRHGAPYFALVVDVAAFGDGQSDLLQELVLGFLAMNWHKSANNWCDWKPYYM